MRLTIFSFLLIFSVSAFSQTEIPTIQGMWMSSYQKKLRVYNISDQEVNCNISDEINGHSAAVKNFKTVKIGTTDPKSGRIVAQLDSENVVKFVVIDYFNLNTDSVKVIERPARFESADAALNCPKDKGEKAQIFYTTEYMNKLSRIKNTPALTKDGYLSFLRDVVKELQKPQNKKIKPEPGKLPDAQAKLFMMNMVIRKEYQGKIIPETLEIAMEKFKNEDGVKKLMPIIKSSFMTKPGAAPAPGSPTTPATTPTSAPTSAPVKKA
jgi:hypothetical protein